MQSQSILEAWDLWKYISGPDSVPPVIPSLRPETVQKGLNSNNEEMDFRIPGNAEERQKAIENAKPWTTQNKIARAHLLRAIPGHILPRVEGIQHASQIWDTLRLRYQKPNSPISNSKKIAITNYQCTSSMDVSVWLDDMQRLYDGLCLMDPHALSDYGFALILMSNLPETAEWRAFAAGLRQRINRYTNNVDPTPINSNDFATAITDEYYFRNKNNPDIQAEVFTARYEANNKGSKRSRAPDASTSTPSKRARAQKTCTNCKKSGHEFADCFAYGGGKQGEYGDWWKGPRNIHLPPPSSQRTTTASTAPRANVVKAESPKPPDSTDPGAFPPAVNFAGVDDTLILAAFIDDDPAIASLPVLSEDFPKSDACF